ncbi:MAG: tRNA (cytidine(34)-2'-O)-methyltransferase [Acidimicrobiales bacterium]
MFNIVLVHPEIPPNTGNVIRLSANVGAALHLVRPLGFDIDDASLRRAGLDYHEFVDLAVHESLDECRAAIAASHPDASWYGFSRDGAARYDRVGYRPGDVLVFGCESSGLAPEVRASFGDRLVALPMRPDNRSLNLSNSVAVVAFEAWRQNGFGGSATN